MTANQANVGTLELMRRSREERRRLLERSGHADEMAHARQRWAHRRRRAGR